MEYTIVPMDRSHVGQIAELERECFSTPWSEAMLTEALFDTQASFIVAESEDGGLLGYAGLHVVLDEGYIDNIAVQPDARRHGVAYSLVSSITEGIRLDDIRKNTGNEIRTVKLDEHGELTNTEKQ